MKCRCEIDAIRHFPQHAKVVAIDEDLRHLATLSAQVEIECRSFWTTALVPIGPNVKTVIKMAAKRAVSLLR